MNAAKVVDMAMKPFPAHVEPMCQIIVSPELNASETILGMPPSKLKPSSSIELPSSQRPDVNGIIIPVPELTIVETRIDHQHQDFIFTTDHQSDSINTIEVQNQKQMVELATKL